jgi:hypothetical protein
MYTEVRKRRGVGRGGEVYVILLWRDHCYFRGSHNYLCPLHFDHPKIILVCPSLVWWLAAVFAACSWFFQLLATRLRTTRRKKEQNEIRNRVENGKIERISRRPKWPRFLSHENFRFACQVF